VSFSLKYLAFQSKGQQEASLQSKLERTRFPELKHIESGSLLKQGAVHSDMHRFRISSQGGEELNFVMETGGAAGLSCGGQIGKLEEVLGQLVAEKQGRVTGGKRGSHDLNES
jgi:hypothetical protein